MLDDWLFLWYNIVTDRIVYEIIRKREAVKVDNSNATESAISGAVNVPFIALESAMARMELANKRIAIIAIIAILAFVISNFAWLHAWMQYDYGSADVTVESSSTGHANYIARDGEINNASN